MDYLIFARLGQPGKWRCRTLKLFSIIICAEKSRQPQIQMNHPVKVLSQVACEQDP